MTRVYNMASAAIAAFILVSGASAASAQSLGFSHAGESVTASGQLTQNVLSPQGDLTTECNVTVYGEVSSTGEEIEFTSYLGAPATSPAGPLACGDSIDFPIIVTAIDDVTVSLSQFVVGTREGPCFEDDYVLGYTDNAVVFDGVLFGSPAICSALGNLSVNTTGSQPVAIIEL